jgi:putative addiction module component (TIGR02574 family)
MPQLTPQVSEVLEKALALSTEDRGLIIDRLVESLDNEPAEEAVEAAWSEEIKRRVEEIQSGKVEMIPAKKSTVGSLDYTIARSKPAPSSCDI